MLVCFCRQTSGGQRSGVAAAAFGLSAALTTSTLAFSIVKLVGAAYLIYLGVKMLVAKAPAHQVDYVMKSTNTSGRSAFLQGILTNVLNPKVALFFLAFLPQFIDPASDTKAMAFLALGATFITTGLIWCLILAIGAARLQVFFLPNPSVRSLLDRAVRGLYLLLGARLAWSR